MAINKPPGISINIPEHSEYTLRIPQTFYEGENPVLEEAKHLPFPIDLEDEAKNENLFKLLTRRRGKHFRVVDGRLVSLGWKRRNSDENKREVGNVVFETLRALNEWYQQKIADGDVDDRKAIYNHVIEKVLFSNEGVFGRLSPKILDLKRPLETSEGKKRPEKETPLFWNIDRFDIRIAGSEKSTPVFDPRIGRLFKEHGSLGLKSINLGKKKDNRNLATIFNMKRDEIYRVNSSGRLEKVTSLFGRVKYHLQCSKRDKEVQKVFNKTLDQLNTFLDGIAPNSLEGKIHAIVLQKIFFDRLALLPHEIFNRSQVEENKALENFLVRGLQEAKEELIQAMIAVKNSKRSFLKKKEILRQMSLSVDKAETFGLAQALGIPLQLSLDGGSAGARYGFSHFRLENSRGEQKPQKIVVVKPGDEGPYGKYNPKWYAPIKRFFSPGHPALQGNSEPQAEADSDLYNRKFDLGVVPPTVAQVVESSSFNGKRVKESSIQMFVEGCLPLNQYLGVPEDKGSLLRWLYPGYSINDRDIEDMLPQSLLERVAIHNFLIEDIDCHFGNILVMLSEVDEDSLPVRLLSDNREIRKSVSDDEIRDFVDNLFSTKNNQKLLRAFFASEKIKVDTQNPKLMRALRIFFPGKEFKDGDVVEIRLIKHDGGSSSPHAHPSGFLGTRFKHLVFTVLPHFRNSFSQNAEKWADENKFKEALEAKTIEAFKEIIKSKEIWEEFDTEENRELINAWISATKARISNVGGLRDQIIDALVEISIDHALEPLAEDASPKAIRKYNKKKNGIENDHRRFFKGHLIRIKNIVEGRKDSFKVMSYFIKEEPTRPMRELFLIRDKKQFMRKIRQIDGVPRRDLDSSFVFGSAHTGYDGESEASASLS